MATASPPIEDVAEDVLARAVDGDQQAFTLLVRHYDRRLRALAYRLLGDRDRMDDVLQEAYMKAYRALPRFRGEARPGTWLYRIVYNACIDELRRSGSRPTVPLHNAAGEAALEPEPGDRTALRGDLSAALARLSPEHRAVVLLVDGDGLDYPAAGAILGVPAGTVASRLSRARAALRSALADGGDER